MRLLDGLKQFVAQSLLGVVDGQVEQIETRMSYRKVRISASCLLDDNLSKFNRKKTPTSALFSRFCIKGIRVKV